MPPTRSDRAEEAPRPLQTAIPLDPAGRDFPTGIRAEAERLLAGDGAVRALTGLLLRNASNFPLAELAQAATALRAAAPTDRLVWAATDDAVYSQVPNWHWRMLQDRQRAECYRRAIEAAVTPGMLVLEIGAGTGLLAMMAARAGAGHVYTAEANPLMTRIARDTIERNGMTGRVTVLEGHSTGLVIGRDLPRPAELLIHEILSNTVLSEGLVPSLRHAIRELLTPDAPLLPERIGVNITLSGDMTAAESDWWHVEGFDLTPLALLDAAAHGRPAAARRARLSAPVEAVEIDLRHPDLGESRLCRHRLLADGPGLATGVEQWMTVRFPCRTRLSSDEPGSHWGSCYHPFAARRTVAAGDRVTVDVALDSERLAIGLAAEELTSGAPWTPGL